MVHCALMFHLKKKKFRWKLKIFLERDKRKTQTIYWQMFRNQNMLFFQKDVLGLKYQMPSEDLLKSYQYSSFYSCHFIIKSINWTRQDIDNVWWKSHWISLFYKNLEITWHHLLFGNSKRLSYIFLMKTKTFHHLCI